MTDAEWMIWTFVIGSVVLAVIFFGAVVRLTRRPRRQRDD
jgi:hypothetical protein